MRRIYICRDNITGLFSAVYDAWIERRESGDAGIAFKGNLESELFCEYVESEESEKKVAAVEKMIRIHLGMEAYRRLYYAALAEDLRKGDAILGTMFAARKIKNSKKIMEYLTNPSVEKVFELSRRVGNEVHYYKEFIRFKELEGGILFSRIDPKSQVLTCVAPHFSNRFPLENWMIYDGTHQMCVVHEARKNWVLVSAAEVAVEALERYSDGEREIQKLWKGFFENISIKERESYVRQRQHLPLWYRVNMVEFEQNQVPL